MEPQVILLLSGKRKCGKDYLAGHLKNVLGERCEIVTISYPIKHYWAQENNLNLKNLLSDSDYKERYRLAMIKWSENIRQKDYGAFCRIACEAAIVKPVWIVSDVRRPTDLKWFKETYGDLVKTIRLNADVETRSSRGYQYQVFVDDGESECGLDDYKEWDLVIDTGKDRKPFNIQLQTILKLIPDFK